MKDDARRGLGVRVRARVRGVRAIALCVAPALACACGGSHADVATGSDAASFDATTGVDAGAIDAGPDRATADSANDVAPADAGPLVTAAIQVDRTTTYGTIGAGFVGLSYEKRSLGSGFFRADNAALIAMVDLLGPSLLRVGGNSVDETVWPSFDAGTAGPDAAAPVIITHADVDGLAAFAKAAHWKVLYGVNMKTSSSSVAEDEASYAATALGSSLYGFEIGNEPDLYTSVASSPGTWDYASFKSDWQLFASAMHDGASAASFTGPASAGHPTTWTVPFAADEAASIALLTQHYYVANGQAATSTIDFLLGPNPSLANELKELALAATTNAIPGGYRIAECNSFYNGGAPGVSDAFGTALWVIDFLFANAQYGSSGVNLHGGGNGTGYTPIADSNAQVVEARPVFYGMLTFVKAGQGAMVKTSGAPTSINFSAYAVATGASTSSVVLSNKDRTTTVRATVDIGAMIASAGATRLEGPSLDATSGVTLGGVAIGADGSFAPAAPEALAVSGSTFTIDVPPASAVLVAVQ